MTRFATGEGRVAADEPEVGSALLDVVLSGRAVRSVLAPVVELETGAPAGYEALARGPRGHPLHDPDLLLAVARRCDRLGELDALYREQALSAAQEAGLHRPVVLFVRVEAAASPGAAVEPFPPARLAALRRRGVHVIAELAGRALVEDPEPPLALAEQLRTWGCGIALDGVGTDPGALALMPLLRPDVVTLDLSVVHAQPDAVVARTMTAVTAYAETEGAAIVAHAVETEEHERTARSLGATHGQGPRYGDPLAPEDGGFSRPELWRPIVPRADGTDGARDVPESPYGLVRRGRTPLEGSKRLLVEITRLLERQATDLGGQAVVLAGFEEDHHFTPEARERYSAMAGRTAFVGALGAGVSDPPTPGVRGADLAPQDPLRHEWDIVVVGPHFTAALVAHDRGDTGPDLDRRFDYVLTYDRATVLAAARSLIRRIGPADRRSPVDGR